MGSDLTVMFQASLYQRLTQAEVDALASGDTVAFQDENTRRSVTAKVSHRTPTGKLMLVLPSGTKFMAKSRTTLFRVDADGLQAYHEHKNLLTYLETHTRLVAGLSSPWSQNPGIPNLTAEQWAVLEAAKDILDAWMVAFEKSCEKK